PECLDSTATPPSPSSGCGRRRATQQRIGMRRARHGLSTVRLPRNRSVHGDVTVCGYFRCYFDIKRMDLTGLEPATSCDNAAKTYRGNAAWSSQADLAERGRVLSVW